MEIGKKIKVLRTEKGLNQDQLAEKISRTRTLISHIERTSKVNYYTLNEIAAVLDVPVTYFTDENYELNTIEEAQEKYNVLSEKVKMLERENELLSEIVDNQKQIINDLKQKSS